MKKVLLFIRNILHIFPHYICSTSKNGTMFSVYVRKRITKNKYNVITVYHKESLSESIYSELVQETDTYERAIRVAKKMCEDEKDAL